MNATHNPGRVAGLWYLLLVLIGPLRLMYIPTRLFVHGNAAATVSKLRHTSYSSGWALLPIWRVRSFSFL
jgi:hypothetical protein